MNGGQTNKRMNEINEWERESKEKEMENIITERKELTVTNWVRKVHNSTNTNEILFSLFFKHTIILYQLNDDYTKYFVGGGEERTR